MSVEENSLEINIDIVSPPSAFDICIDISTDVWSSMIIFL